MSDGPLELERRSLSAAHTPQPAARFRNLGKRGFPKLRREADALHQRWEAKRSGQMLLTVRPRA